MANVMTYQDLDRRKYLKSVGGAAVAGGSMLVAGCVGGEGEYPDQDIEFVIPYSPGGAFDAYARALAEFMPEHLPGDVDVIPENVTGAGGRTGANTVYRADPDGYTIGFYNIPGMVATQVVEDTEYDVTEITWVSTIASDSYVMGSYPESGYETLEDFLESEEPIDFGLTGTGGTSDLVTILSIDAMDLNANRVTGFDGEAEAMTAVIRGEVDARFGAISSMWPNMRDGDIHGVVGLMDELPEYASDADIPVITEYEEYAQIADFATIHFPIGAPPGTDSDRVEVLEGAIEAAAQSDEMADWAQQNDRPLLYSNAAETTDTVNSAVETLEGFRDLLEQDL